MKIRHNQDQLDSAKNAANKIAKKQFRPLQFILLRTISLSYYLLINLISSDCHIEARTMLRPHVCCICGSAYAYIRRFNHRTKEQNRVSGMMRRRKQSKASKFCFHPDKSKNISSRMNRRAAPPTQAPPYSQRFEYLVRARERRNPTALHQERVYYVHPTRIAAGSISTHHED